MATFHPVQKKSVKTRFLNWLGLTDETTIKLYHGYGQSHQLMIMGHVFSLSPMPRHKYTKSLLKNSFSLLRLFIVKPIHNAKLQTEWKGEKLHAKTDKDGFFKIEWKDEGDLEQGWHEMTVHLINNSGEIKAEGKGSIYIPHFTQYGYISDIDDTFLISHSANLKKRLYLLFTKHARTRKAFEGVVKHYQLLTAGLTTPDAPNPFFYVSSSEWNLYDFLLEFTTVNGIPRGVFLLNVLKRWTQLLKTGQNNHQTKFTRIVRILENYPRQRFVLLGDSSQHDPQIYEAVVKHFPKQIHAVYIRDVHEVNKERTSSILANIEAAGVACCFFQHSTEAILHSQKIGLIPEKDIIERY
jgi:phosphatidate phosphatase APP1